MFFLVGGQDDKKAVVFLILFAGVFKLGFLGRKQKYLKN
jgi:hypothetical protein